MGRKSLNDNSLYGLFYLFPFNVFTNMRVFLYQQPKSFSFVGDFMLDSNLILSQKSNKSNHLSQRCHNHLILFFKNSAPHIMLNIDANSFADVFSRG